MTRRVAILGEGRQAVRAALEARGLRVVTDAPELVFCHGGDGTLLRAERTWPGVPKCPARLGDGGRLCPRHELAAVVDRLVEGRLEAVALPKIEARVRDWRGLALNDVVLRNHNPAIAVRFTVEIDGEVTDEITGDGLVLATPFGSTGYFHSITRTRVRDGIGIAFNNATVARPPLVHRGGTPVAVTLVRGPGVLVRDNDPRQIPLRAGQGFAVAPAPSQATVLGLDALLCQACRRWDGRPFNPH